MFKRVDRRRKRKEEEEELGLDEDEREILGLNNTDSSESDSDSSTSSSAQAPSGRNASSKNKRKRRASLSSRDEGDDDEDSQSSSGDEAVDGEDVVDHLSSIASALKDPIQLIRTHPEAWVCIFCPKKVLKHGAMVKVHEASQDHRRRLKRMRELSMDFSPDESIGTLLRSAGENPPKTDGGALSHRAEQRKAKQAKWKERRQRTKEKKAASMTKARAKEAEKEAEKEVVLRPPDISEMPAPSKRLKATSGGATARTTSRPSASPQAEVRKRTKVAQRSKKRPQTIDGAVST
ncbi:hypothetical protein EI94DRAFT_1826302 [Lactarius quietus]|nr:hypothetical protein EI94DRAFT_1826302 [Lactarius quietus]